MTAKRRIATIRLSNKLERNSEYAKEIGVGVVNRKTEIAGKQVQNNREK